MSAHYPKHVIDSDLVPLLEQASWKKPSKGEEHLECCSCFRVDRHPSLVVWPSLPDGTGGNCLDKATGEKFNVSDMYRVLGVPDPYHKGKEQAAPVPPVDPKARMLWESAQPATSHFYADWKNVPLDGLRVAPNGELLIPQRDPRDGQIVGVEKIEPRKPQDKDDKTKKQVNPRGGIFQIGRADGEQPILISEGVSTGYALNRLTGWPVFVAFSAGQLAAMYQTVRFIHPGREIAVAPDYDKAGHDNAEKAAALGATVVQLPEGSQEKDDWLDLEQRHGAEIVKQMFRDQWQARHKKEKPAEKPKTINLLDFRRKLEPEKGKKPEMIGGLFPRGGVSIVAGQQGTGKSVLMQRICSDISLGGEILDGVTTYAPKRKTLFLVGELPVDSMNDRQRTTGWKHDDEALVLYSRLDFAKAEIALDMTDAEGWKNIMEIVRGEEPDMIVFDSFMSFNTADESDMQQMQAAFTRLLKLADETKSAVVLVHHIRKRKTVERQQRLHMDDIIGSSIITRNASVAIGAETLEVDGQPWIYVNTLKTWYAPMEEFAFKMERDEFKVLRGIEINLDPKAPGANRIEAIESAVFVDHKDGSSFTAKEIEEATDSSGQHVRKWLKKWTDEGRLRKEGGGKSVRYSIMRKGQNHISALANTDNLSATPVAERSRTASGDEASSESFCYTCSRIFSGDTNGSDPVLLQEHDTKGDSATPKPGNLEKYDFPSLAEKESARQEFFALVKNGVEVDCLTGKPYAEVEASLPCGPSQQWLESQPESTRALYASKLARLQERGIPDAEQLALQRTFEEVSA